MVKNGFLKTDIDKFHSIILHGKTSLLKEIQFWCFNYGLHCVIVFRFGQFARKLWGKNKILGLIPLVTYGILNQMVIFFHHFEIAKEASIGKGFYLAHYSNIKIGPAVIGENSMMHHNITIGMRSAQGDQGVPTIGNNVWIGTGAVISGDITIGNNVTISAGCVISKNIPEGCLVAGNPGRVIMQNYDNSSMINYKIP